MTIRDSDAAPPGGAAVPPAAVSTIAAATHGYREHAERHLTGLDRMNRS